jgi:hypothetical protein
MTGIPSFLTGNQIVITRTPNGFAVSADKDSEIEQSPAFESWAALVYYLEQNFVAAA